MTDEHTNVDEHAVPDAHDTPTAHDEAHDDHGHGGEALGPIDWAKWAYAIAGAVGGAIVVAMFFFALGGLPA